MDKKLKQTKTSRDKATRKKIEGELDKLWAQIAHTRVKNCQWPGCVNSERLTIHHYFHRSQGLRARWSLKNSICLCYGHHIFQVHTKGDVEPIREILIKNIGQGEFDRLKMEVRQVWKPTTDDLTSLKEDFQGILDEITVKECGI